MNGLFSFSYCDCDSFLHRRNPVMKLGSLLVMAVCITMAFDPWTPLAFFVVGIFAMLVLGRVPAGRIVRPLLFFTVLGGLGFLGSNAFFYSPRPGETITVLWQAGALRVTMEGLLVGVALTVRMMAIVTLSIVFVTTTDPTDFVLSLIQQAHFPFRLGYGILVAYRFVPLWQTELDIIRAAHRIRGVGEQKTVHGRWVQIRRYAIPLLANAIRKSERVAIAMDSKAFGVSPERTYYRLVRVGAADWVLLACAVVVTAMILVAMTEMGLLVSYVIVPE
jgi:energy-coupling factor transport system permease protein